MTFFIIKKEVALLCDYSKQSFEKGKVYFKKVSKIKTQSYRQPKLHCTQNFITYAVFH